MNKISYCLRSLLLRGRALISKEILNSLLRSRYRITEFLYCAKQGWLESAIAKKECEDWEWIEE